MALEISYLESSIMLKVTLGSAKNFPPIGKKVTKYEDVLLII